MAKLFGFAALNSGTGVTSKYVIADFKQYRGLERGFLITHVWYSLELVSGLVETVDTVINVAIGKGSATGGANRYLGADDNMIHKHKFRISADSELIAMFELPEPVLVDEDSLYFSTSMENATGTVSANFAVFGTVVDPTELERAILSFQT